jgi:hypothetical protein
MMAKDDKKTAAPKKQPVVEGKTADTAPKTEGVKSEGAKIETVKAEGANTEGVKADAVKADAAPKKQGMGEGQKPVTLGL